GKCLVFRYPTAKHLVGDHQLTGFVVHFYDDVLAKILERNFSPEPGAEVPNLVRPFFKFTVVSNAALERDRFIFRSHDKRAAARRIAAFATFEHLPGALEHAA